MTTAPIQTEFGIKYAVHIITSNFGALVAKVCENLLKRGPLTLRQLIASTELKHQQVKNSILILMQHNCVQPFSFDSDDGPRPTQYMALFVNMLHRWRFAKFLAVVTQELDKEVLQCELIVKDLLENGRLTLKQILEGPEPSKSQGDSAGKDARQESFLKLLEARFVERCPASVPVIEEPIAEKRSAKSAKNIEVPETLEQRVLAAAAPSEATRFSITTDFEIDACEEKSQNSSSSMNVGEKRKLDDLEFDEECGSKNEVVLWRVNFEEFIRCLRHKACVENVRTRLDEGATVVLRAMLKASRPQEKKLKTEYSVPLSLDEIYKEVINSEAGRSLTRYRASDALSLLRGEDLLDNDIDDDEGGPFSIDMKKIIDVVQNEEVESIVMKRYGKDTYRRFKLLSNAGRLLETEKISEMALVEKKETPKILYKLWKDGYLHMERVVVNTATNKGLQLLLWKVEKPIVWRHVLDEMFHAALNLSLRLAYEEGQNKELTALPANKRTGPLAIQWQRYKNVILVMQASLLKIDDAIMLFHDF